MGSLSTFFRYLGQKNREQTLEELRKKYTVEILLPDAVFHSDKRKESRRDFMSQEEKDMERFMNPQRAKMSSENPDAPHVEVYQMSWKEILSWLIWPVIIGGVFFGLWKFKNF